MLNPIYSPASDRYENGMRYRRSGRSGVLLPEVSLGLWHNFGDVNPLSHSLAMAHYAFDHGITHFDFSPVNRLFIDTEQTQQFNDICDDKRNTSVAC